MSIIKKGRLLMVVFLLVMLVTACNPTSAKLISLENRQELAAEIDPRIVKSSNDFGMQLYQQLVQSKEKQQKNIMISPISISMALAMTYIGSNGESQASMAKTMGWRDMSLDEVNQGNKSLISLLNQPSSGVQMSIANSLWVRHGTSLHSDFTKAIQEDYYAKVTELDFNNPEAPNTINDWINKNTNGKIPTLIESIDPTEVLILMNAVYFNGGWKREFQQSATKEESFTLPDGSTKQVQMMAQTGTYEYLRDEEFQAIRLPYGEGQMDMLIILPAEISSLDDLHNKLWSDHNRWRQPFQQSQGEIKLPRFKVEFEQQLKEPLKSMGLTVPFDEVEADFSGIAPVPPNLFISAITHKTIVEVNEKGTEAAAVTSVHIAQSSAPIDTPFQMTINRPFFFAIEDRQTNAWLFVGSIVEP
ncbi:serpin family protein [Brevibacillus reuszeri]|uniref:serpin family protein n=1 Tax=Brevibacillus reuszeri TaxID=54915 RepID=UPI0028A17773|nr:serpin family protein [Brevibacillus reuszeri]